MIDLAFQAATQAALMARLAALNLVTGSIDMSGATIYPASPGFDYCWWAGSGKLITAAAVIDGQGSVTTPPTFLAGFVLLARITSAADTINGGDEEQWSRSKVAKYFKDNGTVTTIGGLPCVTLSGVQMIEPEDLFAWLSTNNLPAHEWAGGNSL